MLSPAVGFLRKADDCQAFEELTLDHAAEHTRAFIKVQDGCNQFCSYCIIPYARGRVRSRNVQNVLEEVKRLAASGYQEVVLTGIHLSSYGIDCGESLLHLIQMVHQVEGIRRIRLGSLEPRIVTETFAEELAKAQVKVSVKVGEGGKVFGSVSSKEIAEAAKAQLGYDIDKKKIQMKDPIKAVGTTSVAIKLHPKVTAELKVVVKEEA